jgi:hypothetical protein
MELNDPSDFVDAEHLEEHRTQRADRGWSEQDFWNFNSYHSWMMISVLERFKTGVGYPGGMTWDEWMAILDEMIDGFKADIMITDMIGYEPEIHESYDEWSALLQAKLDRALTLFVKYYQTLWD